MKNVLITGASGMVGSLVLKHCLNAADITKVTSLVRKASGKTHPKLTEIVIKNFSDYTQHSELFENIDIANFCLGAYTRQVPDDQFKRITIDYSVAFAQALQSKSPKARLCLLGGAGADRSEQSKTAFARYKGIAENQLAKMDIDFFTFRPGYIYPVTPRTEPNLLYRVSRACYPLIRLMGSNVSIKSTELALAMFQVGLNGADKKILENKDIVSLI